MKYFVLLLIVLVTVPAFSQEIKNRNRAYIGFNAGPTYAMGSFADIGGAGAFIELQSAYFFGQKQVLGITLDMASGSFSPDYSAADDYYFAYAMLGFSWRFIHVSNFSTDATLSLVGINNIEVPAYTITFTDGSYINYSYASTGAESWPFQFAINFRYQPHPRWSVCVNPSYMWIAGDYDYERTFYRYDKNGQMTSLIFGETHKGSIALKSFNLGVGVSFHF